MREVTAPAVAPTAGTEHRARLLEGMARAVAAQGYADTTIADIVREAGVSRRTFYEHFSDKTDCLSAGNGNVKNVPVTLLPLSDTLGARLSGFYLKRDGYTNNLFDGSKIDDRAMYAVRGSVRWEPTDSTTIDLMGYYFREDDNRMRIQKQMCQRDPTGVLGCLPNAREYGVTNANSTFASTLSSSEFLGIRGIPARSPWCSMSHTPSARRRVPRSRACPLPCG